MTAMRLAQDNSNDPTVASVGSNLSASQAPYSLPSKTVDYSSRSSKLKPNFNGRQAYYVAEQLQDPVFPSRREPANHGLSVQVNKLFTF